jgi:hypothetical protein
MKRVIFITILLVFLINWCNIGIASDKWQKGIITKTTETTITIDHRTYNISPNTVIEDERGNTLPLDVLGQKSCCDNIRFLIGDDGYIKKIIVDTSKVVK